MSQALFVSTGKTYLLMDKVIGGSMFNTGPNPTLAPEGTLTLSSWSWTPGDPTDGTSYGVVTFTRSGLVRLPFTKYPYLP